MLQLGDFLFFELGRQRATPFRERLLPPFHGSLIGMSALGQHVTVEAPLLSVRMAVTATHIHTEKQEETEHP